MRIRLLPVVALLLTLFLTVACNEKDKGSSKTDVRDSTAIDNSANTPSMEKEEPTSTIEEDTSGQSLQQQEPGDADKLPPAGKDSRIAYISSIDIMNNMPEFKQADQQLQQFAQGLDQELRRQQQIFQQKYTQYMQDTTVSQAIIKTRTQEMQQMQQRIMQLQKDSEEELAKRKEKLYAPILKKIDEAIRKVAREKGYTHVLDITAGSLVYAQESTNITQSVKAELGIR